MGLKYVLRLAYRERIANLRSAEVAFDYLEKMNAADCAKVRFVHSFDKVGFGQPVLEADEPSCAYFGPARRDDLRGDAVVTENDEIVFAFGI